MAEPPTWWTRVLERQARVTPALIFAGFACALVATVVESYAGKIVLLVACGVLLVAGWVVWARANPKQPR